MTTCYIGFFQRVELGKGPRCSAEYYKGPGRLYSGDSDQGRKKPKSHSSYILSVFLPSRKSRSLEKWGIKNSSSWSVLLSRVPVMLSRVPTCPFRQKRKNKENLQIKPAQAHSSRADHQKTHRQTGYKRPFPFRSITPEHDALFAALRTIITKSCRATDPTEQQAVLLTPAIKHGPCNGEFLPLNITNR